jgi:ribosomal protein S18 acetylase RimI-like enzyme
MIITRLLGLGDDEQVVERQVPSIEEINTLTDAIGWGKRSPEIWKRALEASSYIAFSRSAEGELTGFGRILEDGVMCMFYDIGVHPKYQGTGVGTRIMTEMIDKVKDGGYVSIGLFVWENNPSAVQFYQKFGFETVGTGMKLKRFMQPE